MKETTNIRLTSKIRLNKFLEAFRAGDLKEAEEYLIKELSAKIMEKMYEEKKSFIENMNTENAGFRPIWEIALEIENDWKKPYFGAVPYINAMKELKSVNDTYYADDARSIIAYFLANSSTWKGPVARTIKAELKNMLKLKRFTESEEFSVQEECSCSYNKKRNQMMKREINGKQLLADESDPEMEEEELEEDFTDQPLAVTDDPEEVAPAVQKWVQVIAKASSNEPVYGLLVYRGIPWSLQYMGKFPKGVKAMVVNKRSGKTIEVEATDLNDLHSIIVRQIVRI